MEDIHRSEIEDKLEKISRGDVRTIARVLSELERQESPWARALIREVYPKTGRALVIGVTGSPGSGKSTLVARMALTYREAGLKVGIIAVDPTSPFSGGAILGDRIRMQSLASDPGVFIRSMATRGQLGRTVGSSRGRPDYPGRRRVPGPSHRNGRCRSGRNRHRQHRPGNRFSFWCPGCGDGVQAIKAGVMEIADLFVINKADHPETPRAERELRSFLKWSAADDGWQPPLLKTVATTGQGVDELVNAVQRFCDFRKDRRGFREGSGRQAAPAAAGLPTPRCHEFRFPSLEPGT